MLCSVQVNEVENFFDWVWLSLCFSRAFGLVVQISITFSSRVLFLGFPPAVWPASGKKSPAEALNAMRKGGPVRARQSGLSWRFSSRFSSRFRQFRQTLEKSWTGEMPYSKEIYQCLGHEVRKKWQRIHEVATFQRFHCEWPRPKWLLFHRLSRCKYGGRSLAPKKIKEDLNCRLVMMWQASRGVEQGHVSRAQYILRVEVRQQGLWVLQVATFLLNQLICFEIHWLCLLAYSPGNAFQPMQRSRAFSFSPIRGHSFLKTDNQDRTSAQHKVVLVESEYLWSGFLLK